MSEKRKRKKTYTANLKTGTQKSTQKNTKN